MFGAIFIKASIFFDAMFLLDVCDFLSDIYALRLMAILTWTLTFFNCFAWSNFLSHSQQLNSNDGSSLQKVKWKVRQKWYNFFTWFYLG